MTFLPHRNKLYAAMALGGIFGPSNIRAIFDELLTYQLIAASAAQ